jgi:cephalosporin hydroxylase
VGEPGVTEAFHRLYYATAVSKDTYWLGVRTRKCPLDLWVYDELRIYSRLLCPGSYLVEDSNVNGHPVLAERGPGPVEALEEFLAESDEFEVDAAREKFFLTFNPRGYLRKQA